MTSLKTERGTISFFRLHANYIHVYQDKQRVAIINSADPIADLCVEVQSQTGVSSPWSLWFSTYSGDVFRIDGLRLLARSAGSKFDINKDSTNQEIFTTLLASQLPKKTVSSESAATVTNTILITGQDALFRVDGILSLCCFRHFLCCCSNVSGVFILSAYDTRQLTREHEENVIPLWRERILTDQLETNRFSEMKKRTANLSCLSSHGMESNDDNSHGLTPDLFRYLFGEEAALLGSSILVFSSPSGVVYHFDLKSLVSSSCKTQNPDILCAIGRPCISALNLRIPHKSGIASEELSPFDIPVLNHQLSSEADTSRGTTVGSSGCNCCALVGDNGKCMLVYLSGEQVQYQTVALPGPVVSCTSAGNIIYLSTGKDLYRCKMNEVTKEGERRCLSVAATSLGYSRITGMVPIPGSSLDCVNLLCFSSRGRLYSVEDEMHRHRPAPVAGGQMKDLLLSINHTGTEIDRLKTCINSQHNILAQCSLASHIAAQFMDKYSEKTKASSRKFKFVSCKVAVKQECSSSNRAVSLVLRVTNESSARLFCDCYWSVLVKVTQFEDTLRERSCKIFSKCQPLTYGLGPQCYEELSLPVEGAALHYPILSVTAYLIYDPSEISFNTSRKIRLDKTGPQTPVEDGMQTLCVPLASHEVDILDFLHEPSQNEGSTSGGSCTTRYQLLQNAERSHVNDVVMVLANQKPAFHLHRAGTPKEQSKSTTTTLHSLATTLSTKWLSESARLKSTHDVLKLLLSFTGISLPQNMEGSQVTVATSGGQAVHIDICSERDQVARREGTVGGNEGSNIYSMTLKGEDMATLCLLRAAFLRRLEKRKMLNQSETGVVDEHVRKTLHQLEGMRKDIQCLQDVPVDRRNRESGSSNATVQLYERLRKVQYPV